MTSAARWSLAVTSTLAVLAATLFAAAYTDVEMNDVRYKGLAEVLPGATKYFAHAAPWVTASAAVFGAISVIAAVRRADSAVVVIASIAWLFAFAWVLFCIFVWRAPFILIGQHVSG